MTFQTEVLRTSYRWRHVIRLTGSRGHLISSHMSWPWASAMCIQMYPWMSSLVLGLWDCKNSCQKMLSSSVSSFIVKILLYFYNCYKTLLYKRLPSSLLKYWINVWRRLFYLIWDLSCTILQSLKLLSINKSYLRWNILYYQCSTILFSTYQSNIQKDW